MQAGTFFFPDGRELTRGAMMTPRHYSMIAGTKSMEVLSFPTEEEYRAAGEWPGWGAGSFSARRGPNPQMLGGEKLRVNVSVPEETRRSGRARFAPTWKEN